jgi:hypothetical protein
MVTGSGVGVAGDERPEVAVGVGQGELGQRRPGQARRRVRRRDLGRVGAAGEVGGRRVGGQQDGIGSEQVAVQ